MVTCESWSNLPLNESFANYSEYLWSEYKYGPEKAAEFILNERASYFREAQSKQVDLIRFYYDDREDMFDSHSYAKGGQILHMLRNYVGDEAFFAALNLYLKQHEFQPVEVHDLRLAFEEITGEDLNWFFNQWFLASGHPQLDIQEEYSNGELTLTINQIQELEETPYYRLPVYVDIFSSGQRQRYAIEIGDQNEFTFPVSTQPDLVLFDPDQVLLAQVNYPKTAQELSFQYKNSESLLARYSALEQLSEMGGESALAVAQLALSDSAGLIRRQAIEVLADTEGADLSRYEKELAKLASSDKSTLVRADAISVLANLNPNAYREQFRKGLDEQSYSVVAASAYGYGFTDATDKTEVFEQLEGVNNRDITLVLADYYVSNSVGNKLEWFTKKIDQVSGGELAYVTNYFGQYLLQNPGEAEQGAEVLEGLAKNHGIYYVRMTAYNALSMQEQLPDLQSRLSEIRAQETDPRVLRFYQQAE